jgi:uncharacterized radical SAM superfamily protein
MSRTSKKKALDIRLSSRDKTLFDTAWKITRCNHGNTITFYLPGMIRYGSLRGLYPALSITGDQCVLQCEHCKGKLLEPMMKVSHPDDLVKRSLHLAENGAIGLLLTGGSDHKGRLPWHRFAHSIRKICSESNLIMSAHVGFPDLETCCTLKDAGVKQALIDIMGDEKTATNVYHLSGFRQVSDALDAIKQSGLELIPHIVAGLNYGKIGPEYNALELISRYRPNALIFVVLTPLKGTPMANVDPPSSLDMGRLMARARILMPEIPIALGCERPRNMEGALMEMIALRTGATRIAIWSDEILEDARNLGLIPRFQFTCCSLDFMPDYGLSDSPS